MLLIYISTYRQPNVYTKPEAWDFHTACNNELNPFLKDPFIYILSLPQNSVISDTTSRAQTPGIPPDEDSLMSMPSSFNQSTDDKSELLKILEEVSCSSSSEDSEEEEISEWLLL